MASKAETVGMVTLESLASNTPVIGSNAGGTIELLQNGKLGYLFEPENSESLAHEISCFLKKEKKWLDHELEQSIAKFDHQRVIQQIENHLINFSK